MNLREANLYGYPIWFKLYTARQAFGMDALRPKDWDDLVERMTNDPKLFELFYKFVIAKKLIKILFNHYFIFQILL